MVRREYRRYALSDMMNGNDWTLKRGYFFLLHVLEYNVSDTTSWILLRVLGLTIRMYGRSEYLGLEPFEAWRSLGSISCW